MGEVEGRREFLKKAGTVVWVVPTLQVINMSSAMAGGDGGTTGSVVVTTVPPSTSQPPPECSCSLTETGRQYHDDGLFEATLDVGVNSECVQYARYLRVYIDGELNNEFEFSPTIFLVGPTDALPVVMTVKVLDENKEVLATCQTTVEAPEEQLRGAAQAAGARRGFKATAGR